MWSFSLAIKRAMRSVYFPVLLALCTVITLFAPIFGKEESLPPAGVCDRDSTEISARATAYLAKNGFEICSDEDILRQKIASGEFDCGVIIKSGFSNSVKRNNPDGTAIFITSPLSFADELYKNHIVTAVFIHTVPAITAEITEEHFKGIGVTADDISEVYYDRISHGPTFTFDIENVDSDASFSHDRGKTYLMFFASILIFTAVMYSVNECSSPDHLASLKGRLGARNLLLFVTLPGLSVRVLGIALSLTLSAVLESLIFKSSTVTELLPELFSYTLLILSFAFVISVIFPKSADFRTVSVVVLLASLVLCPAYTDLSAMWRPAAAIRGFLPTYWLWFCKDFPLAWLIAISALAIASAIFVMSAYLPKRNNN